MATKENPQAGRGPVVLDIGGDIGALVVSMPAWMEDLEVEIVPTGTVGRQANTESGGQQHAGHDPHGHTVGAAQHVGAPTPVGAPPPATAPPHVAVVPRRAPDGSTVHSLVYPELRTGRYDLYVRPDGVVALTADVVGGEVTQTTWPQLTPPAAAQGRRS